MSDRIFHWVPHDQLTDWLLCGWVLAPCYAATHHNDYSFLAEFLCDCTPIIPKKEEWRDVAGYEGIYQVSNFGRVRSLDRWIEKPGAHRGYPRHIAGQLIKSQASGAGYFFVGFSEGPKRKNRYVSHLVAETFIGPRPQGYDVAHNDGRKSNNRVWNLRYATRKENNDDKLKHGTLAEGEKCGAAVLSEASVRTIRQRVVSEAVRTVADDYGVSVSSIWNIIQRRTWDHLDVGPGEIGSPEANETRRIAKRARVADRLAAFNKSRRRLAVPR